MSHVGALWRGEISLMKTGIFYGLLGLLALVGPLVALAGSGLAATYRSAVLALSAALLIYALFIAVAVWRSAGNYRGPLAWRLLAKGSVVAVALQVLIGVSQG
jgi:hypothetical protein